MCGIGNALYSEPHQNIYINQLADELAAVDPSTLQGVIYEDSDSTPSLMSKEDVLRIAGFFQQVARNGNPLTKTFAVIVAFYLSDKIRRHASASSSVLIVKPYLDNFEARFHNYLCGTKILSALLPLEIVLREWQLYTKLVTK